jgi:hypothetical protein
MSEKEFEKRIEGLIARLEEARAKAEAAKAQGQSWLVRNWQGLLVGVGMVTAPLVLSEVFNGCSGTLF